MNDVKVRALDERTDRTTASSIARVLGRIPLVEWTEDDVLARERAGRDLVGKWSYSFVATDEERVVGALLSHVRLPERPWYPRPVFYVAGFAVATEAEGRGVARTLFARWLDATTTSPLRQRLGIDAHALQTNAGAENERVRQYYRRLGFVVTGTKEYDDRIDVVMHRPVFQ